MPKARLTVVKDSENASLYTITFDDNQVSEFESFMLKFKDNAKLQRDYQIIIYALNKMLEKGFQERNFRPEGKFNDNVCAIPVYSSKLRLYCIRLSDSILIVGNGGVKKTRTYQEDPELCGYVMSLQEFDTMLQEEIKKGSVTVEETQLQNIDKVFEYGNE